MNAIEVLDLHKAFGEIKAVQGVSFNVAQGEIFSLLGPNGAGKTTTIRDWRSSRASKNSRRACCTCRRSRRPVASTEGVLRSVHEADLGSILGWGFPAYTGGTLSYIDSIGPARFVAECRRLARLYGERFKPTRGLLARAQSGETYYDGAATAAARAS